MITRVAGALSAVEYPGRGELLRHALRTSKVLPVLIPRIHCDTGS